MADNSRQAGAKDVYKGRGVWVPRGQKASWIMEGAAALERDFDVAPFVSRMMASTVIAAVEQVKLQEPSENPEGESAG